jgi:cytochrome P450 / NADPH-cytochrome P450 reductase
MDARFNSFYKQELHPFVDSMVNMLQAAGAKATRPGIARFLMRSTQRRYDADIVFCQKVAADLVQARREHPSDKHDLLNAMLKGTDPKTGEQMTDKSILNNMITFMIAGTEYDICSVSKC